MVMVMRLNSIFFTFHFPFSVLMKQQNKLPNFEKEIGVKGD